MNKKNLRLKPEGIDIDCRNLKFFSTALILKYSFLFYIKKILIRPDF